MKAFAPGRNLRLFSTSIVDQVLLSLGNFLIGFLLIRNTTDFDYGLFVLAQSTITLLVTTQSAWVSGPIMVLAPRKTIEYRLDMIGSIERSLRRFISWVATIGLIIPFFCYARGIWTGLEALVATISLLAGWCALFRDYARNTLLLFSRPDTLLYADVVYVVILVCGSLFAAFGPGSAAVSSVVALALAGAGGGLAAYLAVARDPGWRGSVTAAGPFWRELRPLGIWSAAGAVIYWLYGQSYNYILASRMDLGAVADVNAARLLLMPAFILIVGIKSLLVPLAANWLAKDGVSAMLRRIWLIVPVVMLMNLSYIAVVWFGRDFLTTVVMHKTIHNREMLIVMWAAIVLITLTREILLCAVFVLGNIRSLAWLTAGCAVVALPIMWFGTSRWGAGAPLIGQACGEVVSLIGMLWLLPKATAGYRQGKTENT